jgi:hypothetical protein
LSNEPGCDQINFAEPRLSGQRTLLGRGPEPARRLDEALHHALPELVHLSETQLCLRIARLGQLAEHLGGIGQAAVHEGALRALYGRLAARGKHLR